MFPAVLGLAIAIGMLTAIYIALGMYMRWDYARRLGDEYASGKGDALTREDYIAKGLAEYERSWERKLLYGVFVLPIIGAVLVAVFANLR
jgi:hypothetical protein